MKLKIRDKMIISLLRKNGRIQLTSLSRKTSIPVSTLFEKIKNFRNMEIIKPTVLLNFQKINFNNVVFIMIKSKGNREDIINFLKNNYHTNSIWRINNHYDILAEMVFKNLEEFDEFINRIEERFDLRDVEFEFVVKEIVKEKFFEDINIIKILEKT